MSDNTPSTGSVCGLHHEFAVGVCTGCEIDRLRVENAALAAALQQCANLTRYQETSPDTVANVGRMVQKIASSPICASALEREVRREAAIKAARRVGRRNDQEDVCWANLDSALDALADLDAQLTQALPDGMESEGETAMTEEELAAAERLCEKATGRFAFGEDAAFIVSARDLLPRLILEVRTLWASNQMLNTTVDQGIAAVEASYMTGFRDGIKAAAVACAESSEKWAANAAHVVRAVPEPEMGQLR